ncbi:hypothetical protein SARC_11842 [Sphaeroforma arctica JP610]|uniref:Uncharacterized protein n=1 Tax=Sphaeroforma arctica JP610 TaxID=667725 RepID=A0A0L0FGR1_9EUKA|nr:hypothetical protein SARC_11842 [Sphaeroforma arctica JP610]KNC75636.1 hypothetical protein SARC_11842 [Sphaeroforma arctica JP610]|eukprot:XP_014149538.1 hypothetical protein SARC_11842 [Sphaeroforma arctica JP610]
MKLRDQLNWGTDNLTKKQRRSQLEQVMGEHLEHARVQVSREPVRYLEKSTSAEDFDKASVPPLVEQMAKAMKLSPAPLRRNSTPQQEYVRRLSTFQEDDQVVEALDGLISIGQQIQDCITVLNYMTICYGAVGVSVELFSKIDRMLRAFSQYWQKTNWRDLFDNPECYVQGLSSTIYSVAAAIARLEILFKYEIECCSKIDPSVPFPKPSYALQFILSENGTQGPGADRHSEYLNESGTLEASKTSLYTDEELPHLEYSLGKCFRALTEAHCKLKNTTKGNILATPELFHMTRV